MKKRVALIALLSFLAIYGISAAVRAVRIDKYVGELTSPDAVRCAAAEDSLVAEGPAAVSSLVAGMPTTNERETVAHLHALSRIFPHCLSLSNRMNCYTGRVPGRAAAVKALRQMLPLFATCLNSRSAEVRRAALKAMFAPEDGEMLRSIYRFPELPSIVDAVTALLTDDDRQVRMAAFRVAAVLPSQYYQEDPLVLEALMRAVKEESDPLTQRAAVEAVVVRLGHDRPRDLSARQTSDVIEAIARLADERLGDDSRPIDYEDEQSCLRCITAFEKFGAYYRIERFLMSSSDDVARHAASALKQSKPEQ
jgi:hypothetical protein